MTMSSDENPQQPRPLFLYGPLQALPLLAWAMTGDPAKVHAVKPLVQPARVRGYARFALHGRDYYTAVVKIEHADAALEKLYDFAGETHQAVQVDVEIQVVGGAQADSARVRADLYVWNAHSDDVPEEERDLEVSVRERLDRWLEFIDGEEPAMDHDDEA